MLVEGVRHCLEHFVRRHLGGAGGGGRPLEGGVAEPVRVNTAPEPEPEPQGRLGSANNTVDGIRINLASFF